MSLFIAGKNRRCDSIEFRNRVGSSRNLHAALVLVTLGLALHTTRKLLRLISRFCISISLHVAQGRRDVDRTASEWLDCATLHPDRIKRSLPLQNAADVKTLSRLLLRTFSGSNHRVRQARCSTSLGTAARMIRWLGSPSRRQGELLGFYRPA